MRLCLIWLILFCGSLVVGAQEEAAPAQRGMTTFDGKYSTKRIDATIVYFVPKDRTPLPDWRERVDYYARRIAKFHRREFGTQSELRVSVSDQPYRSQRTAKELRNGDGDFTFFQTTGEVDRGLGPKWHGMPGFPVLLVLSEINWRALDDFYRVKPDDPEQPFEGTYIDNQHFPGAAAGGSRAIYDHRRGVGIGLVSADGWRVPYRGSDAVIYHEGLGHPVGLPHPEPADASVMSHAQYKGWISESFVTLSQKERMNWSATEDADAALNLFTEFTAIPDPLVPRPGEEVRLALSWPANARLKTLTVRQQTSLRDEWPEVVRVEQPALDASPPDSISLGKHDRETPVSYRVDVTLHDGRTEELWGYFQVRSKPRQHLLPER